MNVALSNMNLPPIEPTAPRLGYQVYEEACPPDHGNVSLL